MKILCIHLCILINETILRYAFVRPLKCCLKSIFRQKLHLLWLLNANEIDTNNMKSTWPCKPKSHIPNTNYIPLAHVGAYAYVGSVRLRVGSKMLRVGSTLFGYQHVGISNMKVLGNTPISPTRNLNVRDFVCS